MALGIKFKHDLIHGPLRKSAGTEGFDLVPPPTGCSMFGRYEIGLLCLVMKAIIQLILCFIRLN